MSEPPRPPRRPDDELPPELRALIARSRPPAPLDGATRARMRRRLAVKTASTGPRIGQGLLWLAAALALFLGWLWWQDKRDPIAAPEPDPIAIPDTPPNTTGLGDEPPAPSSGDPDGGAPDGGDPDGGSSRWYPVRNRCTDAVCHLDGACCSGDWDERCDSLLLASARLTDEVSGHVGRCYYHDRETCPSCACEYYLKLGDPKAGSVGFDQGTGCIRDRGALLSTLEHLCAAAACE